MTEVAFTIISILALLLFFKGTGNDKQVLISGFLWLILTGTIAGSGFFLDTESFPPRFAIVLLPAVTLSFFWYSRAVRRKAGLYYLTGIHILRIPIELILYHLFLEGKVPDIMTFDGWNFDIVIGISSVPMLFLVRKYRSHYRSLLIAWNIAGLCFLAFIVTIAILSSPLPFQQLAFDQPDIALLEFPYVFLPAIVVPLVVVSHVITLKQLRKNPDILNS